MSGSRAHAREPLNNTLYEDEVKMIRKLIDPPLATSFNDIFSAIDSSESKLTPRLETTGGVPFVAEAKISGDGRRFISLPHGNRIYEHDWGYTSNSMGKDGQRIGQYSVPLDCWIINTGKKRGSHE